MIHGATERSVAERSGGAKKETLRGESSEKEDKNSRDGEKELVRIDKDEHRQLVSRRRSMH